MTTPRKSAFIDAALPPRPGTMRFRNLLPPLVAVALAAPAWLRWPTPWSLGILSLATLLLALALLAPRAYAPIRDILERFGRAIATLFSWIVLGLVFVAIFIPGHLLLALRRRDPLHRRPDPARASYWEPLPPATDPARFNRQY
jgi:hypothetical protein